MPALTTLEKLKAIVEHFGDDNSYADAKLNINLTLEGDTLEVTIAPIVESAASPSEEDWDTCDKPLSSQTETACSVSMTLKFNLNGSQSFKETIVQSDLTDTQKKTFYECGAQLASAYSHTDKIPLFMKRHLAISLLQLCVYLFPRSPLQVQAMNWIIILEGMNLLYGFGRIFFAPEKLTTHSLTTDKGSTQVKETAELSVAKEAYQVIQSRDMKAIFQAIALTSIFGYLTVHAPKQLSVFPVILTIIGDAFNVVLPEMKNLSLAKRVSQIATSKDIKIISQAIALTSALTYAAIQYPDHSIGLGMLYLIAKAVYTALFPKTESSPNLGNAATTPRLHTS